MNDIDTPGVAIVSQHHAARPTVARDALFSLPLHRPTAVEQPPWGRPRLHRSALNHWLVASHACWSVPLATLAAHQPPSTKPVKHTASTASRPLALAAAQTCLIRLVNYCCSSGGPGQCGSVPGGKVRLEAGGRVLG